MYTSCAIWPQQNLRFKSHKLQSGNREEKKGEVDSILTGLVKDLIAITLNYQRKLQTLSLLLSFKLWLFSSVKMQEKQSSQNFDNFLGAHELNELLYLRLLSELPSSVECWLVVFLHMEHKYLNANDIMYHKKTGLEFLHRGGGRASSIS